MKRCIPESLNEFIEISESYEYFKIMKNKKLDYGDVFKFNGKAHPGHKEDIELEGFITNGINNASGEPVIKVIGYGAILPIEHIKDQEIQKTGKKIKETSWGDEYIKEGVEYMPIHPKCNSKMERKLMSINDLRTGELYWLPLKAKNGFQWTDGWKYEGQEKDEDGFDIFKFSSTNNLYGIKNISYTDIELQSLIFEKKIAKQKNIMKRRIPTLYEYSTSYKSNDFSNVGTDEDGNTIGSCKKCDTKGNLVYTHKCKTNEKQTFIAEGKLGNINAYGIAKLFDKTGKHIGNCADTPNVISYVFKNYPQIEIIQMQNYAGGPKLSIDRDSSEGRNYISRGLDPKLNDQYEKAIDIFK